jgi:predicted metal-dependent phosphoesterase TrpH
LALFRRVWEANPHNRGIRYLRDDASIEAARAGSDELYLLYSESYIPDEEEKRTRPAAASLQEVVGETAGEGAAGAQQHDIRHEPSGLGGAAERREQSRLRGIRATESALSELVAAAGIREACSPMRILTVMTDTVEWDKRELDKMLNVNRASWKIW